MMFCCQSNDLCTYLNSDFRYSIDCAMTCDIDCVCASRHTGRNQEECASKQGLVYKQIIIYGVCCHSNGLCTILNADFRYSIDCAMTCDIDCACTSRHMDRNQKECESK